MTTYPNRIVSGFWWRSLLAIVLAPATLMLGMIIARFIYDAVVNPNNNLAFTPEEMTMVLFMVLVITVFVILGWLLCVLPLTFLGWGRSLLSHPCYTELVWAMLGMLSFNVMFQPFGPSWEMASMSWIPALIGAVAGGYFRWLTRGTVNLPSGEQTGSFR